VGAVHRGGARKRTPTLALLALLLLVHFAATSCGGGSSSAEGDCNETVDVVLWGGTQWLELGRGLAEQRAECAEYYLAIPPADADKTKLRSRRTFEQVRALDPHIHPVAEIRFTSEAGWREWAKREGSSFYDAGVEARRRMAKAGLDVGAGEIWAVNELGPDIREDVAGRREEMREFLRGLYEGGEDLPEARGIVFDIGSLDVPDLDEYKATLQEWLTDGAFWSDLDKYVDYFAEEVYAGPQDWAVPDAPLADRTEALNVFFYHVANLAQAGPNEAEPARKFFERTYVPLTNAAWPHALIAQTNLVSPETMAQFISGEVYAMREYDAATTTVPQDAIGFAWAPNPLEPSYSDAGRDTVLNRLAAAIRDALDGEPIDACQEGDEDWCAGELDDAELDETWKKFASWE
jgi:hypothetical protein